MGASEFSILKVSRDGVLVDMHAPGTQFTCFTGTKVQIPTPEEPQLEAEARAASGGRDGSGRGGHDRVDADDVFDVSLAVDLDDSHSRIDTTS